MVSTDMLYAYWKSYKINFDTPMGSEDILRTNRFLNSILKRRLIVLLSKDTTLDFGVIVKDGRTLFSQLYKNFSVEFVHRQSDKVAHKLGNTIS